MQSRPLSESKIKVAVVGVGYWGRNIVRNFHELGALALLCDADRSVEEGCRQEYESVRFCRDFSVVLSDPSIAAVALATPAATHYEMAKAALEAGKDVFVEKPLAIDVKQGEDLVELAASKNPHGWPHSQVSSGSRKVAGINSGGGTWTDQLPVFQPSKHRENTHRGEYPLELCSA